MKNQNVFLIAGQGTQYYHMGKSLYQSDEFFQYWMDEQDYLFKSIAGYSVLADLHDSSKNKAMPYQNIMTSHAAIFMIEYALGLSLMNQGIVPECLLGISLGELVAFTLANSITLAAALETVYQESLIIQRSCPPCKMYVIFETMASFYSHSSLYLFTELVAETNQSQLVISCTSSRSCVLEQFFIDQKIRFIELPINYGFHTCWLEPAKDSLCELYSKLTVLPGMFPVLSARECRTVEIDDMNKVDLLWRRIRQPFYVEKSLRSLIGQCNESLWFDISPNSVFNTQCKQIDLGDRKKIYSFLSPFKD
ncbi:acyltransferase domain-containing protein [Spirosoma fluviale]|uniref:Malonyl CoA-acyl carrier protein transacylase n=1 Tax=Spirosoma fluviale TaxID=1597977 RepID=A0A286GUH8_9BACT|nr:acyltransferase domain-containing protein [Spirosoma fluviale]SOD99178.1 Malonyl CoA-acyl carrier protein transacylase [Spirosoma fluviale]